MPSLPDGKRGDLLVKLVVEIPTDLTPEQRELLGQFEEAMSKKGARVSKRMKQKVKEVFS